MSLILSNITGREPVFEAPYIGVPASYSYSKYINEIKDQGATFMCCPYSISYVLELEAKARSLCQSHDSVDIGKLYSSRAIKNSEGMSFKEALELLRTEGFYIGGAHMFTRSYCRIPDKITLQQYLVAKGPALMTLPVYTPGITRFWKPSGGIKGYHGVAVVGYSSEGVQFVNSYGPDYGDHGYATVLWDEFHVVKELWGIVW